MSQVYVDDSAFAIGKRLRELWTEFDRLDRARDPRAAELQEARIDAHVALLESVPQSLADCAAILTATVTELSALGASDLEPEDDVHERLQTLRHRAQDMLTVIAQAAGIDPQTIGEPI